MARKKPRQLSAEEKDLWDRVAKTTRPFQKQQVTKNDEPLPRAVKKTSDSKPAPGLRLAPFRVGERARGGTMAAVTPMSPVKMDTKAFRKMARGKMKPEARIDLHGMTQDAAHTALTQFVLGSHARGKRLVLVITGKGKEKPDLGPIPERVGVLRHQVPKWLDLPPLRDKVLQVSQAHISHGGGGAYYVYLSRLR